MNVHPFLCGVVVTLLVETVALFIAAAAIRKKTEEIKENEE